MHSSKNLGRWRRLLEFHAWHIWQRRFWEHTIRDEQDYAAHIDYVHVNPFKHGLVRNVAVWPYSSFHRFVAPGIYPVDWAGEVADLAVGERVA